MNEETSVTSEAEQAMADLARVYEKKFLKPFSGRNAQLN